MKSLMKILIIAVGMLVAAGGMAYAADVTVESGSAITGTPRCEMSITSSNLTVSAPTTMGPSTTEFTVGSPIAITLLDNTVTSASGSILKVKISSSLPGQYGTSNTYYIKLGVPGFTPAAESEITAGTMSDDVGPSLTASDQEALGLASKPAGATVLAGTFGQSASLIINSNKRLYGDTTDEITIQYTLVDL